MLFQTVTALNYLPMALVMARSLRRHIPDARLCILLTDASPALVATLQERFSEEATFIGCADLGCNWIDDMRRYYTVFEFSSACKVLALDYQLRRQKEPECCFIDPDMLVLGDFTGLLRETKKDIVVTYHARSPFPADGELPAETELVISGAVNGGIIYMKNSEKATEALAWLVKQTRHNWFVAPSYGLFCDQHWLSFLPQFFSDITAVLGAPGINIAYWNLHERPLKQQGGAITVGGRQEPALLFHFSGFPDSGDKLSKHSNRTFDAQTESCLASLCREYRALLATAKTEVTQTGDLTFAGGSLPRRMKIAEQLTGYRFKPAAHTAGRFGRLGNFLDRLLG